MTCPTQTKLDNISKDLDNRSKNLVYTNKDLFNNNFMGKA